MKRKNILSSIVATILAIGLLVTFAITGTIFAPTVFAIGELTTISEAYIPSEPATEKSPVADDTNLVIIEPVVVERVETTDMDILLEEMEKCESRKEQAHLMAEAARSLGHPETSPVIILARLEWKNANEDYKYYNNIYTPLKEAEDARIAEEQRLAAEEAARKEEEARKAAEAEKLRKEQEQQALLAAAAGEYPVATYVWNYMKGLGWSDAVCAGILGNMMAEVGGQTLKLQYGLYDSTGLYYGLCQWHIRYYGQIHGASLEAQCNFLRDTIKSELDTYGYLYSYGMNYEQFLQLSNPSDVALCFAKVYERCGSAYYAVRQTNAMNAYNYYVK